MTDGLCHFVAKRNLTQYLEISAPNLIGAILSHDNSHFNRESITEGLTEDK